MTWRERLEVVVMLPGLPDEETVRSAIALATRAPSVHNTQPWRWAIGPRSLRLRADPGRIPAGDPQGRDLLLSCGATLHHLRVAFAAMGWSCRVHRLPHPAAADCIAVVEPAPHPPTIQDIGLAAAISVRRTDCRPYTVWQVPSRLLALLAERAGEEGMSLRAVVRPESRRRLVSAIVAAGVGLGADAGCAPELAAHSGHRRGSPVGVAFGDLLGSGALHEVLAGDPAVPPAGVGHREADPDLTDDDAAVLLVLGAAGNDPLTRLRAGEAMSAVLLTATDLGLASCPVSQPLDVPWTDELVRARVLSPGTVPHVVLRVGWAPLDAGPLPPTPRRPLAEVVEPLR